MKEIIYAVDHTQAESAIICAISQDFSTYRLIETHQRHCFVSLSMTFYPLVKIRKTGNQPDMTEKLLTGLLSINTKKWASM